MRISIELVPRNENVLIDELEFIKNNFHVVDTINIPDLLRFEIRSWEGCKIGKPYYQNIIPHIRAIDIDIDAPLPMLDYLKKHDINEVLILTGDLPQDMSKKIYPSTSIDVIKKFKKEAPEIKIYAAIDQYRNNIKKEFEYIKRKINAGADGFFTQPFFDLRFMEIYAELLEDHEVFWGISPVTSDKSTNYWETKNNVVFPVNFNPTLEWNINFAKDSLDFAKRTNTNVYFMPIRIDIKEYLSKVISWRMVLGYLLICRNNIDGEGITSPSIWFISNFNKNKENKAISVKLHTEFGFNPITVISSIWAPSPLWTEKIL